MLNVLNEEAAEQIKPHYKTMFDMFSTILGDTKQILWVFGQTIRSHTLWPDLAIFGRWATLWSFWRFIFSQVANNLQGGTLGWFSTILGDFKQILWALGK